MACSCPSFVLDRFNEKEKKQKKMEKIVVWPISVHTFSDVY